MDMKAHGNGCEYPIVDSKSCWVRYTYGGSGASQNTCETFDKYNGVHGLDLVEHAQYWVTAPLLSYTEDQYQEFWECMCNLDVWGNPYS
jgi:hypothetical protein